MRDGGERFNTQLGFVRDERKGERFNTRLYERQKKQDEVIGVAR